MCILYENIIRLCEERKITQYRLCKEAGISPSALSDLKFDRRKSLGADHLNRIASVLKVSVDALLSEQTDTVIDKLQEARDVDRILFDVARGMTAEDVELLTNIARKMKNGNRGD